jgi:hypothetical protein
MATQHLLFSGFAVRQGADGRWHAQCVPACKVARLEPLICVKG